MKIEDITKTSSVLGDSTRVMLNIIYTDKIITENINTILKPYDLSSEQYNVLRILRGQKGKAANMSLIQERMLAKTSNTTRLVDKLLLKEFVTRNVCTINRRKIEVLITPAGIAVLNELESNIIAHEKSFADKLNAEELRQLNELLEKYRN
jgi:DNA-binding MarR family transcriptional regulator